MAGIDDVHTITSIGEALAAFLGSTFLIPDIALSIEQCNILACFIATDNVHRQIGEAELISAVCKLPNNGNIPEQLEILKNTGFIHEVLVNGTPKLQFTQASTVMLTVILSLSQQILSLSSDELFQPNKENPFFN